MRGEDKVILGLPRCGRGSPPHARGRPVEGRPVAVMIRITPACAGKTRRSQGQQSPPSDHPRMRGEDMNCLALSSMGRGSPPHARGRRVRRRADADGEGITPACAGKTSVSTFRILDVTDHPRMRGEDTRASIPGAMYSGSPPHARGRPTEEEPLWIKARITPACAGKTTIHYNSADQQEGSPPHARGRLFA